MTPELARAVLNKNALDDEGSFYGPRGDLSLGTGLLVRDVPFPIFDRTADRFSVVEGAVYVLSHECDLDPENDKVLGGYCLICPLLPISDLVQSAKNSGLSQNQISAFLGNIAARKVSRFIYLPPFENFEIGAVMNLNQITSTSLTKISKDNIITAISAFGLTTIDMALENHLRRAKSEALPLTRAALRRGTSIIG